MPHHLTPEQLARAETLVEPALAFLRNRSATLPEAIVAFHWRDGDPDVVIAALAAYQNPDGGFGNGLEVDIKAPVSNPFAARLAMQILRDLPASSGRDLRTALGGWLASAQHADGDWHFAPEVLAHPIAPWFAGWTFPSLNPACCIAGLASSLDLATPVMRDRVATLFETLANRDDARSGEFYNVLPYVEYTLVPEVPDRDAWIDAIAAGVNDRGTRPDAYADAGHFFSHALGGSPELAARIPQEIVSSWIDRLLAEPEADGGWPSPYNDAWRDVETATALATLARLRT